MADAYKCESCGNFQNGSGKQLRVGKYMGTSAFESKYNFTHRMELCDECYRSVIDAVDEAL